jgi:hypothetical protein
MRCILAAAHGEDIGALLYMCNDYPKPIQKKGEVFKNHLNGLAEYASVKEKLVEFASRSVPLTKASTLPSSAMSAMLMQRSTLSPEIECWSLDAVVVWVPSSFSLLKETVLITLQPQRLRIRNGKTKRTI